MAGRKKLKWRLLAEAFVLAVALAALCCWWSREYVAVGKFYYWIHGGEMTAGFGDWGGPDPIWCFKRDVWNQRPWDFKRKVWNAFCRRRGRDEVSVLPLFKSAYDSVTVAHDKTAITWGSLAAVSKDPAVAADVVNSYMDALSALELELLHARKMKEIGSISSIYFRVLGQRRNLEDRLARSSDEGERESLRGTRERLDEKLRRLESLVREMDHADVRTNTMFKAMQAAEVPTKALDRATRRSLEAKRAIFDRIQDRPDAPLL